MELRECGEKYEFVIKIIMEGEKFCYYFNIDLRLCDYRFRRDKEFFFCFLFIVWYLYIKGIVVSLLLDWDNKRYDFFFCLYYLE